MLNYITFRFLHLLCLSIKFLLVLLKTFFTHSGVVTYSGGVSTMKLLETFEMKSDAILFVVVTRIESSRDPLQIIPAFTRDSIFNF